MCAIWKISPGEKGEQWKKFLHCGCMSMGNYLIDGLDDLAKYKSKEELRNTPISNSGASQLWKFYTEISYNDIIIAYGNKRILGIGLVIGDYEYKDMCECWLGENYTRKVKWAELVPPVIVKGDKRLFGNPPNNYGILNKNLTLIEISEEDWDYILQNYKEIERAYAELKEL
ncbi:MAG: hypothetical protein ACTSRP_24990 [Candidatus Helarchaeota archaeon]